MSQNFYIIPGMGQSCNLLRYKKLGKVAESKGYKVFYINPDWDRPISEQVFSVTENSTIFGFSMGAILACLVAKKYDCKKLILASASPIKEFDLVDFQKVLTNYMSKEKASTIADDVANIKNSYLDSKVPKVTLAGKPENMEADFLIPNAKHYLTVAYIKKIEELI